jgi:hypothetical protein
VAEQFPLNVSFDPNLFGIGVNRLLRNCITAVRLTLDVFLPRIEQGARPLRLAKWDKKFVDLPYSPEIEELP